MRGNAIRYRCKSSISVCNFIYLYQNSALPAARQNDAFLNLSLHQILISFLHNAICRPLHWTDISSPNINQNLPSLWVRTVY
jgi:hypothetical protein